jgi:hypothetical protein
VSNNTDPFGDLLEEEECREEEEDQDAAEVVRSDLIHVQAAMANVVPFLPENSWIPGGIRISGDQWIIGSVVHKHHAGANLPKGARNWKCPWTDEENRALTNNQEWKNVEMIARWKEKSSNLVLV